MLSTILSLQEAAAYIARNLGSDCSETTMLRLALDRQLTASVQFIRPVNGRPGRLVPRDQAKIWLGPLDETHNEFVSIHSGSDLHPETAESIRSQLTEHGPCEIDLSVLPGWSMQKVSSTVALANFDGALIPALDKVLELDVDAVIEIHGEVWDLYPAGAGRIHLHNDLLRLNGGPTAEAADSSRIWLAHPDSGLWLELCEKSEGPRYPSHNPRSYAPTNYLPEHALLVVRRAELDRFIKQYKEQKSTGQPAGSQASSGQTKIIGTLEKMLDVAFRKAYAHDRKAKRNASTGGNSGSLAADMQAAGYDIHPDTVRERLKDAERHRPKES